MLLALTRACATAATTRVVSSTRPTDSRAIAPGGSLVVQVPNARCLQAAVLGALRDVDCPIRVVGLA